MSSLKVRNLHCAELLTFLQSGASTEFQQDFGFSQLFDLALKKIRTPPASSARQHFPFDLSPMGPYLHSGETLFYKADKPSNSPASPRLLGVYLKKVTSSCMLGSMIRR